MKIVALLAIRNEEAYLANCLRHLARNGVDFAIIDNGSTDGSMAICRREEFARHLVAVHQLEHEGVFVLAEQLRTKMQVAAGIDADWFIHVDADEIMHPYRRDETLGDAIRRLDRDGWTAVNFDEFVFLPVETSYRPDIDGWQPMRHYYFFEPFAPRLMRAWRNTGTASMVESGGHVVSGEGLALAPERFAMRHYIVRDQSHAFRKYPERAFASAEIARGWHLARIGNSRDSFELPPAALLARLDEVDERQLDRARPKATHFWRWDWRAAADAADWETRNGRDP